MLDDRRLDTKLSELSRELRARPLVPGFPIMDAFTVQGVDEAGRPGLFAAVLLAPNSEPELDTLTAFREVLTKKLKQLDTSMPAWPIVVQGAPELIDGMPSVPGGSEYFQQLKGELQSRSDRLKATQERKASLQRAVIGRAPPADKPIVGKRPVKMKAAAKATGRRIAKVAQASRTARR